MYPCEYNGIIDRLDSTDFCIDRALINELFERTMRLRINGFHALEFLM